VTIVVWVESVGHVRPAEGAFQSKTVNKVELSPHDDPRRSFSGLLDLEVAIRHAEMLRTLGEEVGEDALLQPVRLIVLASIHEDVLLSRVPVDVREQQDISAL